MQELHHPCLVSTLVKLWFQTYGCRTNYVWKIRLYISLVFVILYYYYYYCIKNVLLLNHQERLAKKTKLPWICVGIDIFAQSWGMYLYYLGAWQGKSAIWLNISIAKQKKLGKLKITVRTFSAVSYFLCWAWTPAWIIHTISLSAYIFSSCWANSKHLLY